MPNCFVLARPQKSADSSGESETRSRDGWEPYRNIFALKRLGFTIDEMRQMTTADFIAITDIAVEDAPQTKESKPLIRDATQADIDMLLG